MPMKKPRNGTVQVLLNGHWQTFKVKDGKLQQNEGLFDSTYVEAVRVLRRWPRRGETLEAVGDHDRFVQRSPRSGRRPCPVCQDTRGTCEHVCYHCDRVVPSGTCCNGYCEEHCAELCEESQ